MQIQPTVRLRWTVWLPSYLSDITDITDHYQRPQSWQRVDTSPEMSDDSKLWGAAVPNLAENSHK